MRSQEDRLGELIRPCKDFLRLYQQPELNFSEIYNLIGEIYGIANSCNGPLYYKINYLSCNAAFQGAFENRDEEYQKLFKSERPLFEAGSNERLPMKTREEKMRRRKILPVRTLLALMREFVQEIEGFFKSVEVEGGGAMVADEEGGELDASFEPVLQEAIGGGAGGLGAAVGKRSPRENSLASMSLPSPIKPVVGWDKTESQIAGLEASVEASQIAELEASLEASQSEVKILHEERALSTINNLLQETIAKPQIEECKLCMGGLRKVKEFIDSCNLKTEEEGFEGVIAAIKKDVLALRKSCGQRQQGAIQEVLNFLESELVERGSSSIFKLDASLCGDGSLALDFGAGELGGAGQIVEVGAPQEAAAMVVAFAAEAGSGALAQQRVSGHRHPSDADGCAMHDHAWRY
jgi:hypothetical protein